MKFTHILIGLMTVFLLASCHQKKRLNETEITQIAKEAYIYGYPIVENYRNMSISAIDTQNPNFVKPFNELAVLPVQLTAEVEVTETEEATENGNEEKIQAQTEISVKPGKTDMAYGSAWLDLRREPAVVTISQVESKRYFSVQFVDLFGNDFDYFSSLKDGSRGGRLLIVAPGWKGDKPEGISRVVESPSAFVFVMFRLQTGDMTGAEKNTKIMNQYKIEPLSQYAHTTPPPSPQPLNFPVYNSAKAKTPEFFTYLNFMLQFCTIPKEENGMMKRFAEIGIVPGTGAAHHQYMPSAFGRNVTTSGKKMRKNTTRISRKIYGQAPLATRSSGRLDRFMAMNRLTPSGGVSRAISLVITQKTPKNTGSMPTDLMMGRKTGASTTMVASVSMNMPRKNSSAAMSSRIRMGLVVYSIIWAASCCGIWYMVRNRPKMVDTPTTMRMVPVEMFASFMALNTSFRESFLVMKKPTKRAYHTATTEASTGVHMPA